MTMDKVYQQRPSGLTGATATTTTGISSTRPIHSIGLSLNGSVNSLVNSQSSLSRLPQRRESKIPDPNGSPGCVLNGIPSPSCQPTLSSNFSSTATIAPPKKFLNPPSKLLSSNQMTSSTANGTESSFRSVLPTTVFKCKSTSSHLIVPSSQIPPTSSSSMTTTMVSSASPCVTNSIQNSTTTSATCNGNNSETSRGIRPPRSASSMSSNVLPSNGSMSTGKSTLTVSRSHITKHSVINNGLATVGRSVSIQGHHRSVTLRDSKEDREAPRRAKTPSSSSSPSTSGTLRGNNNSRSTAGSLTNGLNCNRSDSTPSLSETDSGSEKRKITGSNKSLIRSNFGKGLGRGVGGGSSQSIPLPKSRPNSVCLDNSTITSSQSSTPVTTSSNTVASVNGTNTVSKGTKNSLRPLSSSGIPKTGLSGCYRGERPSPSTSEDNKTDTVQRRRRVVANNGESHLAPTRSEPNVARVSPIRRSIAQIGNGDSVTSRPGSGLKEDNHQQPKQQHHQYSPGDKMDQDNYNCTGLAGRNVASKSSSSSNVTSNAMVPSSISSPTPLSSVSTTSSSSSIIATSSAPSTTVTTTVTTTSTSFHPTLMHQLPLGLSSVNRASEPMLPIRSISTAASSNTVSTLKSVIEESLPVKARSILSLSSPSSPTNPSVDNKDAYPQIKTIDLSGNILSFLDSSTRTISSSCDLISTSTRCDSNNRSSGSLSLSSGNFNSNVTESSHSYSNGFMSPVLEDERSSPSRESIESPFESPFNQTVIDKSKSSLTNLSSSPTINGSLNTDQQVNKVNENGTTYSTINSSFNNNATTTVSSSASLISKVNRRNKCILPSEAELSLKTDQRLQNNGLSSCGSIMELNSNGSNIISTTPPPPSTLQPALPPPPLILQSIGLTASLTNQVKRLSKNGEFRGSTISLLSGSSSFSATEERHNQEMKKLREELNRANTKVETLNQQLKNSNDMIQTFGKSLETLRLRLQQCSLATDQKDREIARLKTTIEVLRRECANGESTGPNQSCYGSSSDIETRRDKNKKRSHKEPRSPSRDREGINTGDSGSSGWFKGSIQRAFKKNRSRNKSGGSMSDIEGTIRLNNGGDSSSLPSTPLTLNNCSNGKTDPFIGLDLATSNGTTVNGSLDSMVKEESELIEDLKKQLREKEKQLNDIRLEVLLTASQTESLNDRMCKMNKEMSLLRSENHRLQCLLRRQSITSSIGSLTSCFEGTLSCNVNGNGNHNGGPASSSSSSSNGSSAPIGFGIDRKIPIRLGTKRIGLLSVNNQITWDILDETIRRTFDTYLRKIDAERLEMRSTSLISYSFGSERFERKLSLDKGASSILNSSPLTSLPSPIDFLSRNNYISLYLRSKLDYLIMDTCTPKSVLEKITSHLKESRRLIICGPPNCGKSFIAMKCCQFLLEEYCMDCATGIASISVRENSEKEIECFISNVLNCDEIARPKAIVFKGIHNLANFASLMKLIHGIHSNDLPLLLCTMRGVNNCTTNLQIYHNFRSVIYNQSSEPCKNLLSRVLRKKAVDAEIDALIHGSSYNFNSLSVIIDWFQQLFHHLNLFLEAFSSPLTPHNLGPSVFFPCPLDIEASQEWFIDTWNNTIVPNVKQIVEDYSSEAIETSFPMQDPLIWVKDNYPWIENKENLHKLSPIIVKSDGSVCKSKVDSITDQLHNTLLRLQEVTKG